MVASQLIKVSNLLATSISPSSGTLGFKIIGAVRNPAIQTAEVGKFIAVTKMNEQSVDSADIVNPFKVDAGQLFNVGVGFEPSVSAHANPQVQISFTLQHQLVKGSTVSIRWPSGDIQVQSAQPTCLGLHLDASTCLAKLSDTDGKIELTIQTLQNLPAFTQISLTVNNFVRSTTRYQGGLQGLVTIQTITSS